MAETERPEAGPIHEGGCLCGAVRYRISGPAEAAVHCHCRMCQRAHGAPVVTWITVPADRFAVTKGTLKTYRSSDHGERRFCAACGSQIVFRSNRRPDDIDVTVASLDDPDRHPPDRHIWTSSRIAWLHLDENLPAHERFSAPAQGS
jgi:hypothetical protein